MLKTIGLFAIGGICILVAFIARELDDIRNGRWPR